MNFPTLTGLISEWLGVIGLTMLIGTSPRFKNIRPIAFLYPRREGILSLYLFSLIFIFAVIYYTPALSPNPLIDLFFDSLLPGIFSFCLICLIPFLILMQVRKQPWRSAGWSADRLNMSLRLSLALVFLTIFLRGALFRLLDGVSWQEIQNLLIWLGIALIEETIFRGYLQTRFSNWLGKNRGWFLTAVLFSVWKIPRFMYSPHPLMLALPLSVAFTFLQGLLLGWIYYKNGHVAAGGIYSAVSAWISYPM